MTDLELTRLCAEAIGYKIDMMRIGHTLVWIETSPSIGFEYSPLYDYAQAMELVTKLRLDCVSLGDYALPTPRPRWFVSHDTCLGGAEHIDIKRAIVECVAKMQAVRRPLETAKP